MMIKPAGTSGLLTPATVNEVTVKAPDVVMSLIDV